MLNTLIEILISFTLIFSVTNNKSHSISLDENKLFPERIDFSIPELDKLTYNQADIDKEFTEEENISNKLLNKEIELGCLNFLNYFLSKNEQFIADKIKGDQDSFDKTVHEMLANCVYFISISNEKTIQTYMTYLLSINNYFEFDKENKIVVELENVLMNSFDQNTKADYHKVTPLEELSELLAINEDSIKKKEIKKKNEIPVIWLVILFGLLVSFISLLKYINSKIPVDKTKKKIK